MDEVRHEPNEIKTKETPRKRANELDGKTWLRYSVSVRHIVFLTLVPNLVIL